LILLLELYYIICFVEKKKTPVWWIRKEQIEVLDITLVKAGVQECKIYWGELE
jgi:hypothetical protein